MPSFLRNVSGGTSVASWKQPKKGRNDTGQVASYWSAGGTVGPPSTVEYLIIAGGGGGGVGGGGAGGYRTATGMAVASGSALTVTVGAGGAANYGGSPPLGENSVFNSITSSGGGG